MPIAESSARPTRRPTNLPLDKTLLQEAKALGIDISRAAEVGIAEAVRERWQQAYKAALNSSNEYVESYGLPLSRHRQF